MIVKCPNPECHASYDITPEKLSRGPKCKRCGTPLVGEELSSLPTMTAAPAGPGLGERMAPTIQAIGEHAQRLAPIMKERFSLIRRMADNATWAVAFGLLLIVCATVFPQLDRANVASREAYIVVGDVRQKRLEDEHAKKDRTPEEEEKRKASKERWAKEKSYLEADLESAELSRRTWPYWYRWAMLFGLTLLGAGGLAYIRDTEPPVRRILGAIILATIILSFIGSGVRLEIGG